MDSGLETAGALATATAAANVLDPPAARVEGHGACLNCEAPVNGAYCSNCGQKAHLHRSIFHAVEELLHGILHFDSKLWNTLPLLVFRPGKLTWDYVHGRRARFISPVALFLLTVFAMFFAFGFLGANALPGSDLSNQLGNAGALASANTRVAELDRQIREASADPARKDELAALKPIHDAAVIARDEIEKTAKSGGKVQIAAGDNLGTVIEQAAASGDLDIGTGDPKFDGRIRKALQNPEFVFYKMQQKGYKLSFLLVPLSLPWMWLLFAWKKDVHAYDHVVFLLYSISFMSLLFIAAAGLAAAGFGDSRLFSAAFMVIPVAHIYAQLKGGYRLGWFSAAWRTALLSLLAIITLIIYFVGILLLGLLD